MVKEALVLARLARYMLRRISEAKRQGRDTAAYYNAFHKIVQLLPRVLTGKISPEDMKPLLDFLDKSGMSVKMDGGPGSGNHGHKGIPGQVGGSSPKSGNVAAKGSSGTTENPNKSGGSKNNGSSGNGGSSSSTPTDSSKSPKKGNTSSSGGGMSGSRSKYSDKAYKKTLVGAKTKDGNEVKSIHPHALEKARLRDIYPSSIKEAIEKPQRIIPGNKGNRSVYIRKGTWVIYDHDAEDIRTVIYKGRK